MPRAARPRAATPRRVRLLIATRKGLWTLTERRDAAARGSCRRRRFLGHIVHHAVLDPRDGKTLLAAARTGHLGPDRVPLARRRPHVEGSGQPPAFAPDSGRVVDHTFWLTPGHASQPGVWYAGTSPQGLFRSDDGGATWEGVDGFNAHPQRKAWCGGDQDGTPDGPKLHSVLVDPRDPAHLYIAMSSGGVFESIDAGADWNPLNQGVRARFPADARSRVRPRSALRALVDGNPDRLYQQNHCGIYRLDRPATRWERIGDNMPKSVGDIGLPMVDASARCRNARGCFRWTAPTSGRASRPAASPRRTARATAARRGSARPTACRSRRPGGR